MTNDSKSKAERMTIILHSGSYDRVSNALSLATIGLSSGMEAYILLTYEAVGRFVKGHFEDTVGTEPDMYKKMHQGIEAGKLHSIEDKLAIARDMGLKLYVCNTALATMGVDIEDMVDEVDDVMGLMAFIQLAKDAAINWYI
jgi:peroxiredoxin family protein